MTPRRRLAIGSMDRNETGRDDMGSSEDRPHLAYLRYGRVATGADLVITKFVSPSQLAAMLKGVIKDWKFDPIPKDDSAL